MNERGGREACYLGLANTRQDISVEDTMRKVTNILISRLAQLVERVTSNDEVSRSSRLMGIFFSLLLVYLPILAAQVSSLTLPFTMTSMDTDEHSVVLPSSSTSGLSLSLSVSFS